ncbi:MAG: sugar transferase [Chloroflexota bacterium]
MIRRHHLAFQLALMAGDGLTAAALFVALSFARFGPRWTTVWAEAGLDPVATAVMYSATWVVALWVLDLYRLRARMTFRSELFDILRAAILLAVATFSGLFLLHFPDVSRTFLVLLFASQILLTVLSRSGLRALFAWGRSRGHNVRYVLLVGDDESAERFADRLERHLELGLRVLGHLSMTRDEGWVRGRPVLGRVTQIEEILHGRVVDEVAICLPVEAGPLVESIARLCEEEGKIVRIPLEDMAWTLPGGRLEELDGLPILSLVYGPDRAIGLLMKRALDLVLGAVAVLILGPVMLAVAAVIRAREGGPVLFRQTRIGLNGRPFHVVKFRTMVTDAEELRDELRGRNEIQGHAFKLTDDPRLTATGRVLRATSLDELPQLWNVLRGEMSLVGPRPPLPDEVEGYDLWHRRRLAMKPGITGLWQVQARREPDFDRWVELDLAYIDRWSVWLDLKIIVRTIPAMLQGR